MKTTKELIAAELQARGELKKVAMLTEEEQDALDRFCEGLHTLIKETMRETQLSEIRDYLVTKLQSDPYFGEPPLVNVAEASNHSIKESIMSQINLRTAAETGIKNSPASATDTGDHLTKEMDKDSGLGKFEDKVNQDRDKLSETQRTKEHKDPMRTHGPHIRLETAASAKEAVAALRQSLALEGEEIKETKDKAEHTLESVPEEKKEADTLKTVLKDLSQAEKDLAGAEKELDKIEPGIDGEVEKEKKAPKKEDDKKEDKKEDDKGEGGKPEKGVNPFAKDSSVKFSYSIRRTAEDIVEKVEPVIEDVKDVIDTAKDAIKDAEKIIKHEDGGEKKEEPKKEEAVPETPKDEKGLMPFMSKVLDTIQRIGGHKVEAVSAYPPGKTQEDKGEYETKEKMSQGQFEVKEWNGMAKKDESLRAKEHRLKYTDIKERAPLQGISLKASFVSNKLPSKSAWVLYRGNVPVMQATFANVAGTNRTPETYKKFTSQAWGDQLVAKAKAEGLKAVLADTQGTLVKTAAEVGNAPVAGENMDASYLKKYYAEAYGDSEFASGLVKDMGKQAIKANASVIKALEAKIASVTQDRDETVKAYKCVAVSRLKASRGLIDFTRTAIEKEASDLMVKSSKEIDTIATDIKKHAVVNTAALVAATVPDKGDNSTPGAEEMANAQQGIGVSRLDAVQDGPTPVKVDGQLPPGTESLKIDESQSVNPSEIYKNQRKPLESMSSQRRAAFSQKAQQLAQRPGSQVVPQLTKTASETQQLDVPDMSNFFGQNTHVARLQAMGIDPGVANKNFARK